MLVKTADVYKDMREMGDIFDFSNYTLAPEFSKHLYDISKKAVPGLLKDETGGFPIERFCGLRSKLYCIVVFMRVMGKDGNVREIREKSATSGTSGRGLSFDKFEEVRRSECIMMVEEGRIISEKHKLFTVRQKKIGLSALDIKRFLSDSMNGNTRPFGHWRNYAGEDSEDMILLLDCFLG